MTPERIPGYDYEAALARLTAAEQRKNDRVHAGKIGRRSKNKTARKQRRNQKRGH